tara:strand:- start:930 stop:1226 length:297 start_codon:yes stop_codon:yes gene_type:complete
LVKISISILFLFFSYLQYNDPDSYIWISLYLLVAVFVFLKGNCMRYISIVFFSACSMLFMQNIHLLLTQNNLGHEPFSELGGIFLILILSYFKLKEEF